MAEIDYVTAWRRADPRYAIDAVAFWTGEMRMPRDAAEQRVSELCSLAYSGGQVAGVTTVAFMDYPILRCRFAFFRCAVSADYRRQYLATFLVRHTLTTMEAWSLDHPEEKLQGIAAIFQAWELGSKAVNPQWADWNIHLNLAGYTNTDEQVRVAWFRHARLT